jgi:hypothetical protein
MRESEKHFELAVQLSRDALKALLIINGGAATALVALMDKTDHARDYTPAVICFAIGTVLAVISSCFGYLSQLHYANHRMEIENGETVAAAITYRKHNRWQTCTIVAAFFTLFFMVIGIVTAAFIARP